MRWILFLIISSTSYATSQELATSLPIAQRDRFIQDMMMELKCSNYFEVSIYECQRWKMQQAEAKE